MKTNSLSAVLITACALFFSVGKSSGDIDPISHSTLSAGVSIFQEAENYSSISGFMKVIPDGMAFNKSAIQSYGKPSIGWTKYIINIPQAGVYVLWGRVKGNLNGWSNSFFVSMDNGNVNTWDFNKQDIWLWERLSDRGNGTHGYPQTPVVKFNLTAGQHVLTIANREYDCKIDCFVLTNNLNGFDKPIPPYGMHIQAPVWGEIVTPGQPYEIKWTSYNVSALVNIDLSKDQGNTFAVNIATATPNDGSFIWNVPSHYKLGKAVLRITDTAGPACDVTWGFFALINPLDPHVGIFLLTGNGGENLIPGKKFSIKYRSFAFNSYVNIYYSTDNGTTWKSTGGAYEYPNAGYRWTVPNEPSTKCLFKVADAFDGVPFDISNSTFTILPPGPAVSKEANSSSMQSASTLSTVMKPDRYQLGPNYPNPFNPVTRIPFSLPEPGPVRLTIYDVTGQEIETLVDCFMEAGFYQMAWNAADKPTGVYITRLTTRQQVFTQKMLLVK